MRLLQSLFFFIVFVALTQKLYAAPYVVAARIVPNKPVENDDNQRIYWAARKVVQLPAGYRDVLTWGYVQPYCAPSGEFLIIGLAEHSETDTFARNALLAKELLIQLQRSGIAANITYSIDVQSGDPQKHVAVLYSFPPNMALLLKEEFRELLKGLPVKDERFRFAFFVSCEGASQGARWTGFVSSDNEACCCLLLEGRRVH